MVEGQTLPEQQMRKSRGEAEAYDSDPKPDVGFGELITDEELLALEQLFDFVQGREHRMHGGFICFGAARKTGLVNAICSGNASDAWDVREHENDQLLMVL